MSRKILTLEDVKGIIEKTKHNYNLKSPEFKISYSSAKNGRIASSIRRTKKILG